jgi:signal transduction histidine kinase
LPALGELIDVDEHIDALDGIYRRAAEWQLTGGPCWVRHAGIDAPACGRPQSRCRHHAAGRPPVNPAPDPGCARPAAFSMADTSSGGGRETPDADRLGSTTARAVDEPPGPREVALAATLRVGAGDGRDEGSVQGRRPASLTFGQGDAAGDHDGGPLGGRQPARFEVVPVDPSAVLGRLVADLGGPVGAPSEQGAEHSERLGVVVEVQVRLEIALFVGVLATLYAAWHLGSVTKALACMAVAAIAPLVVSRVIPEEEIAWTPWAAANVLMFVLGRNLQRQRVLIEQLEAAREALADQSVAEERQRIARELHDLAGHTLAAVLLHVTGARHVLRRDPDEAERGLLQAEAVGRGSLDQIRSTVASLRTSGRGTGPPLAGSADLVGLVEEYRRAGLEVTTVVASTAASIEGPVGTALHRIGREALANVARHAPGNRVELALDLDPDADEVRLVVADHGRAAASPNPTTGTSG